jgi:hypothetical protein
VIVGHDPQMSWLLHALAGAKWHTLTAGELMLLEEADPAKRRPYRAPRFVLSPSDPDAATALRERSSRKWTPPRCSGLFSPACSPSPPMPSLNAFSRAPNQSRSRPSGLPCSPPPLCFTTFLAGAGIALLTLALADPVRWWWLVGGLAIAVVVATGAVVRYWARPPLGVKRLSRGRATCRPPGLSRR